MPRKRPGVTLLIAALDSHLRGFGAMPPPSFSKKLANYCLGAEEESTFKFYYGATFIAENQAYTGHQARLICRFSGVAHTPALFEFNKAISKKGAAISKDFEKNSTDFKGFRMDFENATPEGGTKAIIFDKNNLLIATSNFLKILSGLHLQRGGSPFRESEGWAACLLVKNQNRLLSVINFAT